MSAQIEVVLVQNGTVIHEHRINGRPVLIGRSPGSDLKLAADGVHRALLWTEDGNLWIRDLDSEAGVYVGGRRLRQPIAVPLTGSVLLGRDIELKIRRPEISEPARYPYRLEVSLQAATGPEAHIEDLTTGQRCVLRSNNRVSMLYLLARQIEQDASRQLPIAERGWCSDEEIACGVWGRNWQRQLKSHLYVLVHRVRKELKEAGFDPQCIEKKRRHSRAWIQEAQLR
jgi:pSer/pThr/pTyr-binding forkhead associated (FHA) protein